MSFEGYDDSLSTFSDELILPGFYIGAKVFICIYKNEMFFDDYAIHIMTEFSTVCFEINVQEDCRKTILFYKWYCYIAFL